MPALVQRTCVVLVAGEVAARTDSALAVAYFNQGYALIDNRVIEREILEVAKGRSRMIELREGLSNFLEFIVVVLVALGSTGLVAEFAVASALEARCVEGVDMTKTVRPRHFKAVDTDKVIIRHSSGGVMTLLPLAAHAAEVSAQVNTLIALVVEGV